MVVGGVDPVTLEVIHNALLSVTAEMKNVVVQTAVSPLWREAGDVSCAILTDSAELVAQGKGDIPAHMATMPFSLVGILERIPLEQIEPGDALIQNDPYSGGNTHLPDFMIATPVFAGNRIIAFSAVRGHWADFMTATAREIYEEGLIIPPIKLYKQGKLNQELVDIILANSRKPRDRVGDLRAQYAGCVVGEARVKKIVEKYGESIVRRTIAEILDRSERFTRAEIAKMPDGMFTFTDFLDDDGNEDGPVKIQVTVTIADSDITVDFTGTDPQKSGGINNTYATTSSAAYYAVKCVTDPGNPVNSGCYRPIKVVAPVGSLVNCQRPAPMAAYHETQSRICDAVFGAFAQVIPDRVPAAQYGSQGGIVAIMGTDSRPEKRGERFILFDCIGGPSGGTNQRDGLHGTRTGTGNTGNTPVEIVEITNPVLVEAYEIVPDTCGAGRFRGGCAVRRVYRILAEEATVATIFERTKFRPYGLFGGKPGSTATVKLKSSIGSDRALAGKSPATKILRDDIIEVQSAGAGGYGDPFLRDPALVREDCRNGFVSLEAAKRDYGRVVNDDFGIDRTTTE